MIAKGVTYMSVSFSRWLNFPAERRLRNGAKTKAGPLEAEQLSRLGNTIEHLCCEM